MAEVRLAGQNLNPFIFGDAVPSDAIQTALNATENIVFREYSFQVPVNKGALRQFIRIRRRNLEYSIDSDAQDLETGFNYPKALITGTGSMLNKPDFGYTPGRVRSGTVLSGIGGIRPNKFNVRTAEKTKSQVRDKFATTLRKELNKTGGKL